MTKPVFTNLAPNTQQDDVALAWRLMSKPWLWRQGPAIQELEKYFCGYLPIKHAITFESGRTGLFALLKTLDFAPGDEVLVQAFTCVAVPNSIIWAGGKPIYVDCDEGTYNMDPDDVAKKISSKTKAIIIQHTFGCPAELDKLIELARTNNLFVIEDCAHAIGTEYQGRKVGTFGDAALFSFGRDKAASAVFGGLIATNRDDLAEKLEKEKTSYPFPSCLWVWHQLMHPFVTSAAKSTYDVLGLGKIILALVKRLRITSRAVEPQERKGLKPSFACHRLPNAIAAMALHQMGKLEAYNVHRQEIAEIYRRLLKDLAVGLPALQENARQTFIRFTITVPQAQKIRDEAKAQNVHLGDWYDTPIAPRHVDYQAIGYAMGSCPVAERLADEVVNLPTNIHITPQDAERIAGIIKSKI